MVQRLVAALVLTLVLAGCGGTDEERVGKSITKFATQLADGDPEKACKQPIISDKKACARDLGDRILALDAKSREALRDVKVTDIRVVGRVAESAVDGADTFFCGDLQLRK